MCKNFLGLTVHESDELLHWNDEVKEAIKIREAWDKIPKELLPYVKILIEKSRDLAHRDAEDEAGEGL